MYASALVAIDFSPATARLLKRLEHLHRLGTRKLLLLHVLPKGGDVEDALERLQTKAARLNTSFETECLVREGRPAQTIMQVAEERDIPLLVLAARGHSLARRLVLGSVADEVVHWTSRAVLLEDVADDDAAIADGPVLLATDGSAASAAAESLAMDLAQTRTLEVVSVVDNDALERGWEITQRILKHAESRSIAVRRNVETGRASEAIARVAAVNGASLIVVGRRVTSQRGLGSTAQKICEIARRPVLLVPTSATPVQLKKMPATIK